MYVEFKFHRKSNSSSPRPLKAGSLFKDFSRLSSIKTKDARCLVIYFTDDEMAKYFANQNIAYSNFWNLNTGHSFNYDDTFMAKKLSNTFVKASEVLHKAKIDVVFNSRIGAEHHLRVFEINKI